MPASGRHLLLTWTNRVIGYQDPERCATGAVARSTRARRPHSPTCSPYADELAADKRRRPADDVMSALAPAQIDGERLDAGELEMFFFLLVIAGSDTTRSALPGGVLTLAEHPDAYRRLRQDPALLPATLEEILRRQPPVLSFRRTATRDLSLAGQPIRAGEKIVVYHVSAHYDEREFADPCASTPRARRTAISRSSTARTSASARTSRAGRCTRSSPPSSPACRRSSSTAPSSA
jgi:cytochrome P450